MNTTGTLGACAWRSAGIAPARRCSIALQIWSWRGARQLGDRFAPADVEAHEHHRGEVADDLRDVLVQPRALERRQRERELRRALHFPSTWANAARTTAEGVRRLAFARPFSDSHAVRRGAPCAARTGAA